MKYPFDAEHTGALLLGQAQHRPERRAFAYTGDGTTVEAEVSYGELDHRVRRAAAVLAERGLFGQPVLVMCPTGVEMVTSLFACFYAGAAAVPAPPPTNPLRRTVPRLEAIVKDCGARAALTSKATLAELEQAIKSSPVLAGLEWIAVDELDAGLAELWKPVNIALTSPAMLQYTSGSTSTPKGVVVAHDSLLPTLAYWDLDQKHSSDSVMFTWLPNFHDLGLIYGLLEPVYCGMYAVMMPAVSFVQRPIRWLRGMTKFRATHSHAPNFAYDLCCRKIAEAEQNDLDLSAWEMALNAAEPVRVDTMKRFADKYARNGFSWTAFCPGYGLAEATVKVSIERKDRPLTYVTLDSEALEQHRVVEVPEGDAGKTHQFAGYGELGMDTEVAIVDAATSLRCAPDCVGEVWVRGPIVARGYLNRPEATEETFRARIAGTGEGPYLRTGDLGFVKNGMLFITGRLKDLIIVRGENHYPQDLEWAAQESMPDVLRPGCVAAFPVDVEGEEQVAIVAEVQAATYQRWKSADPNERTDPRPVDVVLAIRRGLSEHHNITPAGVALIPPSTIPKTSSGKIQRRACHAALFEGTFEILHAAGALRLDAPTRD